MIRIAQPNNSETTALQEAVDSLKFRLNNVAGQTEDTTLEKVDQLKITQEIKELENKVEEVTQLLCKTTLSYMVRFQLKDDLEYYHEIIEKKRQQLLNI